ncbi:MAG: hypothetical protein ACE5HE_13460, partial [Phycisphaerae bacterium]
VPNRHIAPPNKSHQLTADADVMERIVARIGSRASVAPGVLPQLDDGRWPARSLGTPCGVR